MTYSDQRKLIRFGNSSYIIAIPKRWIDKNKLKKGDVLFLEETPTNEIILRTTADNKQDPKSITLSFEDKRSNDFIREFSSAYINNYDEIIIVGKDLDKKKELMSKILQNKVGIEVSEQSKEKIIVKDILDLEAISTDKIIRRLDNILRSMFADLKEGITAGKIKEWTMNELYSADNAINKFYFLGLKIIRKCQDDPRLLQKLKLDSKRISDAQWIILHLEYLGDEMKRLAKVLHSNGVIHQKDLLSAFNATESNYILMINSYYNNDTKSARELAAKKKATMEMYEKLFLSKKNVVIGTETVVEKLKSIAGQVHNISRVVGY